jgi:serine/threonine-protein kinase
MTTPTAGDRPDHRPGPTPSAPGSPPDQLFTPDASLSTDVQGWRSTEPEPAELPAASVAGRFRPVRPHARGGLGEVLLARDEELNRPVALKRIQERRADDPDSRRRFLREAEITARLQHPGIVPVYGLTHDGHGRPCYAMRFIEGQSLQDAVQRFHAPDGPGASAGRAAELRHLLGRFVQVCNAVAYAHSKGVIHRDLKPANVMLGEFGETLVVDWGLAKPVGPAEAETAGGAASGSRDGGATDGTELGQAIGTPAYMSPEQAAGRLDELGPAADVFSLGATLYAVLTGRPPYQGRTLTEVIEQARSGRYPPPRQVRPDVPPALAAVCQKALAARPADRYATAQDLARDIDRWLADEPVGAYRDPWRERARRWAKRHRAWVAGGVAALLVAVIGLSVGALLLSAARDREAAARWQATENEQEAVRRKQEAEANFQMAFRAVDDFHTAVSENDLLNAPGLQPLRRQLLQKAEDYYRTFVRQRGGDPALRANLAEAAMRLGLITFEIGSFPEAVAHFRQAEGLYEALRRERPDDVQYRRALATIRYRLAYIQYKGGELTRSLEGLGDAVTQWRELVREGPNDVPSRDGLAAALVNYSQALRDTRQFGPARDALTEAVQVYERLVGEHPGDDRYQTLLASQFDLLGQLELVQQRFDPAEAAFRRAVLIREEVARRRPADFRFASYLANSRVGLGMVYLGARRLDQAAAEFTAALEAREKLARENPEVTAYQSDLVVVLGYLGQSRLGTDPGQARAAFARARAVAEGLVRKHPAVRQHREQLLAAREGAYHAAAAAGDRAAAVEELRDLVAAHESLIADFPDVPLLRLDLVRLAGNLGHAYLALGRPADSEAAWRKAVAAGEAAAVGGAPAAAHTVPLAQAHGNVGNLTRDRGQLAEAAESYGRGLQTLDALPAPDRQSPAAAQTAAQLRLHRAQVLDRLGRYAEAVADAEAAAAFPQATPESLYDAACVTARAAAAAAGDAALTESRRAELADRHAARAVELLRAARARGCFAAPDRVAHLKADPDLESLRPRPDFRALLAELEAAAPKP